MALSDLNWNDTEHRARVGSMFECSGKIVGTVGKSIIRVILPKSAERFSAVATLYPRSIGGSLLLTGYTAKEFLRFVRDYTYEKREFVDRALTLWDERLLAATEYKRYLENSVKVLSDCS